MSETNNWLDKQVVNQTSKWPEVFFNSQTFLRWLKWFLEWVNLNVSWIIKILWLTWVAQAAVRWGTTKMRSKDYNSCPF